MTNISFENQGANTYLVYEMREEDNIDTLCLGMITNNKIHGIAPVLFTQMNDKKYLKYNITSKVSLKELLTKTINREKTLTVFSSIVSALLLAEEYMIEPSSFVFDLNYIFADVSTWETVMICLPIINNEDRLTDLSTFFKNVVFSMKFDQSENCDYVAKIISHLNSSPVLSLQNFKRLMDELADVSQPVESQPEADTVGAPQSQVQQQASVSVEQLTTTSHELQAAQKSVQEQPIVPGAGSNKAQVSSWKQSQQVPTPPSTPDTEPKKEKKGFRLLGLGRKKKSKKQEKTSIPDVEFAVPGALNVPPKQNDPLKTNQTEPNTMAQQDQPSIQSSPIVEQPNLTFSTPNHQLNFGETTVLNQGTIGETTVLSDSESMQNRPCLIRFKNNEKVYVDKPVFRIGKEKSYVDYFIGDNTAISRSHANIITRDGEYFIVDTNSTNHTYVNGVMIQSNVETKIAHGTKIRLANEDFEFRLY